MSRCSVRHNLWRAGGALAVSLAAIYLTGCVNLGGNTDGPPIKSNNVGMTTQNGVHYFTPPNILVSAGDTVTWSNGDMMLHTVTADRSNPVPGGPDSGSAFPFGMPTGSTYRWTVPAGAASGTVWFYHCYYHGLPGNGSSPGAGMSGSITVQ